jgi:hypothetical protein
MTTTVAELEPKLDKPGAGLPFPELLIARALFLSSRLRGNRQTFDAAFRDERAAIATLVEKCPPELLSKRVLIPRLRGLEDSSRYWSVLMTLDHLRIVNRGITDTIASLSKGIVPNRKASTAAVKPNSAVTNVVIHEYEIGCDHLLDTVSAIPDLNTKSRFTHPWFGPLNAAGWHALAGRHMQIHRRQLEAILHALRLDGASVSLSSSCEADVRRGEGREEEANRSVPIPAIKQQTPDSLTFDKAGRGGRKNPITSHKPLLHSD